MDYLELINVGEKVQHAETRESWTECWPMQGTVFGSRGKQMGMHSM
jgi:hypothetical protein